MLVFLCVLMYVPLTYVLIEESTYIEFDEWFKPMVLNLWVATYGWVT